MQYEPIFGSRGNIGFISTTLVMRSIENGADSEFKRFEGKIRPDVDSATPLYTLLKWTCLCELDKVN